MDSVVMILARLDIADVLYAHTYIHEHTTQHLSRSNHFLYIVMYVEIQLPSYLY